MANEQHYDVRYLVRDLSRADLEGINRWRNDRDIQKWLISPFRYVDGETDQKWFEGYMNGRSNNVRLAVCERKSGNLIGAVYVLNIDWVARSGAFGILIGEKALQGCGAGGFATRSMLRHAFRDLNLHRIDLDVLVDNERAIRLYRRVGFVEEGVARQAVFKSGEYADLIRMSILSAEFVDSDSGGAR